jgi:hypothetical protein
MLGRPHRVGPLLASIRQATPEPHRVVFVCTPGDSAVPAVEDAGFEPLYVVKQRKGDYARKIQAGIEATSEPLIFTGADDLHFHPGWFPAARARITDKIGVVGTQDLCNRRVKLGVHATHFLVARWYITVGTVDQPGHLFHDGYAHEFVDDELVGTARMRDAWAFAPDSVVEHLHPMAGKAPSDALYDDQRRRMGMSKALYERRRRLWMFPSS